MESAVTTKLKGIAYTNFTDEELSGVPKKWKHLYKYAKHKHISMEFEIRIAMCTTSNVIASAQAVATGAAAATTIILMLMLMANIRRIWDVTDFVVPPTENNAFFVTTNVIITPNQTQGACAEDPTVAGAVECDPKHPGERGPTLCSTLLNPNIFIYGYIILTF